MFLEPSLVAQGALASYGVSYHEAGRLLAKYVQRVLAGTSPRNLPVEMLSRFGLAVNLRTARGARHHDSAVLFCFGPTKSLNDRSVGKGAPTTPVDFVPFVEKRKVCWRERPAFGPRADVQRACPQADTECGDVMNRRSNARSATRRLRTNRGRTSADGDARESCWKHKACLRQCCAQRLLSLLSCAKAIAKAAARSRTPQHLSSHNFGSSLSS